MIPKIIHYCWFGRGEMPELALKCIESWHKYMPDYEYKLWNEDNFDISSNQYVKEAYEARKFAFVTDYVRLHALNTEGGIYMDTDVEVLKPFDPLLRLTGFIGFEGTKSILIGTGTIACQPDGDWVKELIREYDGLRFKLPDGSYDMTPNPVRITRIMAKNGLVQNGLEQDYKDMHIFPTEYFCPRQTTGEMFLTDNTFCDHQFMGSWREPGKTSIVRRLLGQKLFTRLIKIKRRLIG